MDDDALLEELGEESGASGKEEEEVSSAQRPPTN